MIKSETYHLTQQEAPAYSPKTWQVIKLDWERILFLYSKLVEALNCWQTQWQYIQVTHIAKLSAPLVDRIYFRPTGRMETEYAQPAITAYFEIFHNTVKYLNVHLGRYSFVPNFQTGST